MPIAYITRHVHFSASHRLHNPGLSAAENEQIYGLCNNANGYGHNYELYVTIKGEPDPRTGMIMDLKELKTIINREIVKPMDHKHLNDDVDFLAGIIPTAENLAIAIWQRLKDKIPHGELYKVKLYETPRNFAIYKGE
ncbi:MAG TPA: 6-carboxytetrahydropterin synthase [bacterium]|nr:6-carboxytetrahydropterin synthase [bacterium]HPN44009.1 6-carboxytetrahydropterin synthase [bacterium]